MTEAQKENFSSYPMGGVALSDTLKIVEMVRLWLEQLADLEVNGSGITPEECALMAAMSDDLRAAAYRLADKYGASE